MWRVWTWGLRSLSKGPVLSLLCPQPPSYLACCREGRPWVPQSKDSALQLSRLKQMSIRRIKSSSWDSHPAPSLEQRLWSPLHLQSWAPRGGRAESMLGRSFPVLMSLCGEPRASR